MFKSKILLKIDALIDQAKALHLERMQNADFQKNPQSEALLTSCLAFVRDIVGIESQYYLALKEIKDKNNTVSWLKYIGENLKQLRIYVDEGWTSGIKNLISAEIFESFLEMGEYLLGEGYKDPAAVIVGSVLETHLRDLCNTFGVPITMTDAVGKFRPVKADKMNADLAKNGTYNMLEQKQVTAWLDLRNKAAHGDYAAYDKNQVEGMLNGVRDFIIRNPA